MAYEKKIKAKNDLSKFPVWYQIEAVSRAITGKEYSTLDDEEAIKVERAYNNLSSKNLKKIIVKYGE